MKEALFDCSGNIKAILARLNIVDWSNTETRANTTCATSQNNEALSARDIYTRMRGGHFSLLFMNTEEQNKGKESERENKLRTQERGKSKRDNKLS